MGRQLGGMHDYQHGIAHATFTAGDVTLDPPDVLTNRQLEILTLLHRGKRPDTIADHLALSVDTVRTTIRDACRRLGASGSLEALARARELGLIPER